MIFESLTDIPISLLIVLMRLYYFYQHTANDYIQLKKSVQFKTKLNRKFVKIKCG